MPQRVLYMLEKSGNSKACKKASRLCWPSLNRTNVHFIAFTNRVCSQERGNKRGVQVSLWAAKPIQWPGQAQAVPAWLQARASWCRSYENYGRERSTYGQQSLVWGMTQPYEMFCPSNKLMLTNMLWCVVHFWEGTSCKWLGLETIMSLSVPSGQLLPTQKLLATLWTTILYIFWWRNCWRHPNNGLQFAKHS